MGHTRLGSIPTGQKWQAVVATMAQPTDNAAEDVERVALKALEAAQVGMMKAIEDDGLRYTFYILTQLVLSSREEDWRGRLSTVGIDLPRDPSLFDLTSEAQKAVDDYLYEHGHPTDVSEMAQQAAGEAVATLANPQAFTLFGGGDDELRAAVRGLSTKKGFAALGQKFFGLFMAHYLNFYLSRVTASQVGGTKFRRVEDVTKFNQLLQTHCEQTALIVRNYCGEWYSKTEYKEGINLDNTSRFMAVALKKLENEMRRQGKGK